MTTARDRPALAPDQQELALRFLNLARSIARPFKIAWPGLRDDFESAAGLALVESAEAFEPERGIKFITFARHRIRGALRDVQRSVLPLGFRCDPKGAPKFEGTSVHNRDRTKGICIGITDNGPVGEDFEDDDALEVMLRKLPARHAEACRQLYGLRKTQHEAARALGYSQSRLSYVHREALEILREEIR